MAIVKSQDSSSAWYSTGNPTATLNITTGDIIVVWIATNNATPYITSVTDDCSPPNTYTTRSAVSVSGAVGTMAYCTSAGAGKSGATITCTRNENTTECKMVVTVVSFTKTGTASYDTGNTGSNAWGASPWDTGTITTTGTDEVCVVGYEEAGSPTYSNHQIGGVASTVITTAEAHTTLFYNIFTETKSNIYAHLETSGSNAWVADLIAIKAAASTATVNIVRLTGAGPTETTITSINSRANAEDAHSTSGTTNGIKVPSAGQNSYSYWVTTRLKCDAAGAGTINNVKWYTDGTSGLGSGVTVVGNSSGSYVQATGTPGTTGTQLNQTNHAGLSASVTNVFTFTATGMLSISGSISATAQSFGNYMVYQVVLDETSSVGATPTETVTWRYDET